MSNRAERRRAEKAAAKGSSPAPRHALKQAREPARPQPARPQPSDLLASCALIDENGEIKRGFKSHAELRGYEPARPDHTYGFWTKDDRFVTRDEAAALVGWTAHRELLSSDVW
jgi:hypothetical protein